MLGRPYIRSERSASGTESGAMAHLRVSMRVPVPGASQLPVSYPEEGILFLLTGTFQYL